MELGASVASHEAAGLRRPTMASAGSLPIEERLVAPTGAVGEIEAVSAGGSFRVEGFLSGYGGLSEKLIGLEERSA